MKSDPTPPSTPPPPVASGHVTRIALLTATATAILAGAVLAPACRKQEKKVQEAVPPTPPLPNTSQRPLSPAHREALAELGEQVARLLTDGKFEAIAAGLDVTAMTQAAFAGLDMDANPKWKELRDGLVRRLRARPTELFANLEGVRARFLRLHETPSGTAALVRGVMPSGAAAYFDIFPKMQPDGSAKLANIYNYATGLDVPDSLRAILFALAPQTDRSLADRLFGSETSVDPKILTELENALNRRDPEVIATVWPQLPPKFRQQRPIFMSALQVLMRDTQSPAYLAALTEAREAYAEDPLADLLSIDWHFLRRDLPALEACLDRVEKRLGGPDAQLATLRASGRLQAGDLEGADQALEQALTAEPDFLNAHLARLKLRITQHRFDDAIVVLDTLHDRFGRSYYPPPAERGDVFAEFHNYPPYQHWLARHPQPSESTPPPAGQ